MDDDVGSKAPVTRLRRRLSVEHSEESKSPAPSTPTKKRGGRTAKPQLELIAETPEKTPNKRTTRKSIVKDVIDEEKPLTPSRRSARIRSNTSIISDTPQNYDSPRAKRATRRTSQIGSDNEAPSQTTTPAKTRRTRKDSITNADKPTDTTLITDVISEEPEIEPSKLSSLSENIKEKAISPNSPRKSPRLQAKKSHPSDNPDETSFNNSFEKVNLSVEKKNNDGTDDTVITETPVITKIKELQEKSSGLVENVDISLWTRNLIEETAKKQPLKTSNVCNKSLSSLQETNNKRSRTKSWTTLSMSPSCDSNFFSDNESKKKKVRSKLNVNDIGRKTGSGDSISNNSFNDNLLNNDTELNLNSSIKRKKKHSLNNSNEQFQNSYVNSSKGKEIEKNILSIDPENDKEENFDQKLSDMQKLFDISPEVIKSKVYIEDSDSNTETMQKKQFSEDQCVPEVPQTFNALSNSPQKETTVNAPEITSNEIKSQSCEPMDIDETMPENVVLNDSSDNSKNGTDIEDIKVTAPSSEISVSKKKFSNSTSIIETLVNESHSVSSKDIETKNNVSNRKSIDNSSMNKTSKLGNKGVDAVDSIFNMSENSSNRNTSISKSVTEKINSNETQNKSTLVLSQFKDEGVLSPAAPDEDNSSNVTDTAKGKKTNKTVSNTDYLTSTPLHDKIGLQVMKKRVPIDVSNINTKQNDTCEVNSSMKSQTSNSDSSDEVSDDESRSHKLFIDEADEAPDDYESGDSQDEEERQYQKEHEIVDRGETITSDEEISNDTDYEKDSFIVSSDEEDKELLDGSGDDLAMSDNELSMSAKSKKKYNDRKVKEQKEASREMFKARHSLDSAKEYRSQTNSKKLDLKLLDSDDDENTTKLKSKKKNRLRLNSTQESNNSLSEAENSLQVKKKKSKKLTKSITNSDADDSIQIKKKKVKRLSESVLDTTNDEKEITINETHITEKDPLEKIKEEPNTPQQSFTTQNFENIELDENMSFIKANESRDPLQATKAQDNEDDDSDISSNPEITTDYQNLLSTLNNINNKKNKNLSLNIDNKPKEKSKEPIINQLNLSLTKKKKGTKSDVDGKNFNYSEEENSSDAIDMKLLFTEDSNDSDEKPKEDRQKKVGEEDFIPLKRTEAKTNLLDTATESTANTTAMLNTSSKKNKKANVSISDDVDESVNKSLHVSLKKKKNANLSIDQSDLGNRSVSNVANNSLNISVKKQKKQRISASDVEAENEFESRINETNKSLNTSTAKKKRNSMSIEAVSAQPVEEPVKIIHESSSKKKKKSNSITMDKDIGAELELSFNTSGKKRKNSSISESLNESAKDTSITLNNVYKHNAPKSVSNDDDEMPEEVPFKSEKVQQDQSPGANTEVVKQSKGGKKAKNNEGNTSSSIHEVLEVAARLYAPKDTSTTADQNDLQQSPTQPLEIGKKRKKRKNKNSKDISNSHQSAEASQNNGETRKRKMAAMSSFESAEDNNLSNATNSSQKGNKKKRQKTSDDDQQSADASGVPPSTKKNRKRKKRDDDFEQTSAKVMKETNRNQAQVPRLPLDIIKKLDEKPSKEVLEQKKANIVSTSDFIVETATAKIRKNKPSHYLEDSIYLNQSTPEQTIKMGKVKKPKVLPFVPTATTSGFGFTTNFQISVIPTETKFVAKTTDANFKNDYLQKKVKKFGTYELFKTQRKVKLSKF